MSYIFLPFAVLLEFAALVILLLEFAAFVILLLEFAALVILVALGHTTQRYGDKSFLVHVVAEANLLSTLPVDVRKP